jgi:hypothetical protein
VAADQAQEFLRRGYILTAIAMLLRHRATNSHPVGLLLNCVVDPHRGKAVRSSRTFNRRPTVLAGRTFFAANIDAATHDVVPA